MSPFGKPFEGRLPIPQRASLLVQVTDILRESLGEGLWPEFLPSERVLAVELQVGRPILRAALAALQGEGRIRIAQGRRTRVVRHARARGASPHRSVGLVAVDPVHRMGASELLLVGEVRHHLQEAGYAVAVYAHTAPKRGNPDRSLERIAAGARHAAWILLRQPRDVHQWFAANHVPVMVLGSTFADVPLPWFNVDYQAVCRHAVHQFRHLGHRRIALLIRDGGLAGDMDSEKGFLEAAQEGDPLGPDARVIRHDGTVISVCRELGRALSGERRPTGLLIGYACDMITVMTHLMNAGLRIPADVSLISRVDEELLDHFSLGVARYVVGWPTFARRFARAVVRLAEAGRLPARGVRIIPEFRPDQSLGIAP